MFLEFSVETLIFPVIFVFPYLLDFPLILLYHNVSHVALVLSIRHNSLNFILGHAPNFLKFSSEAVNFCTFYRFSLIFKS